MLMDEWTDARMDDRQKVITIAHPEHSSGEQKTHAHLQTMEKTCAKFQKDWYKIV